MNLQLKLDGKTVVNAQVEIGLIAELLIAALKHAGPSTSTPITVEQASELIKRVDVKSVDVLRRIATNDGYITWQEMKAILGIKGTDWSEFTSRHGKGITRALRNITGGKQDGIIHTVDEDEEWNDPEWTDAKLYVDGQALASLKAAFQIA